MDAVSQFLDMGGYAGFVWPAYGIAAIVLVGLLVISRRQLKAAEKTLDALSPDGGNAKDTQP